MFENNHRKVIKEVATLPLTGEARYIYHNTSDGYKYGWNPVSSSFFKMASDSLSFATIVYVNTTTPTTATIFDLENPPTINDNTLKTNPDNLYIGVDGSTWTYRTSTSSYITYQPSATTAWYLASTTTDAGNDKVGKIWRVGPVSLGSINNPLSLFDVGGSFGVMLVSKNTNYTAASTDCVVIMTEPNTILTLPAPTNRRVYTVKNGSTGVIRITGLIDRTTSNTVKIGLNQSLTFQADTSKWNIIGSYNSNYALSQQGSTGNPQEQFSSYYASNGNFISPITMPNGGLYVGAEMLITSDATSNLVVNTTNTNMTSSLSITTGQSKLFKWSGSKWILLN